VKRKKFVKKREMKFELKPIVGEKIEEINLMMS
jgi:hypothetical protein